MSLGDSYSAGEGLGDYQPGLSFHRVEAPTYPLFREPQYLLALANKIARVAWALIAKGESYRAPVVAA